MQPLEWSNLWNAMRSNPETWHPTSEAMFDAMLNCLPPARMGGGRFLVGEPDHHNAKGEAVFAAFKQTGSAYFAKYQTIREFEANR